MKLKTRSPSEITNSAPYRLGQKAQQLQKGKDSQPYANDDQRKWAWLAGYNDSINLL